MNHPWGDCVLWMMLMSWLLLQAREGREGSPLGLTSAPSQKPTFSD